MKGTPGATVTGLKMTVQNPEQKTEPLELEILSGREDLERLRPSWDRLAALHRRDGMFRAYAWNALWLRYVAPRARPHVLAFRSGEGELVGVASLCETVFRDRFVRLPALTFTGREIVTGDFLDVLAAPGREEAVRARFLRHVEDELRRRPLVVLGELHRDGATACGLEALVAARGLTARWQEERTCPFIELPASQDAYLRTLSRNMRSNLKRRTRQLLDEGGCEVLRLRGPEEVLPRLPDLVRLHEARWRSVGQPGTLGRPGLRAFLEAFIAQGHPLAGTELYLLLEKGRAAASLLFFRWGDAVLFYQGGWDPESPCARLSPNLALFGRAIGDAIDDGCRFFEFLQGDEPYKQKFAAAERRTATLLVAGRALRSRAYLGALGVKDRLQARFRRGT